MVVMMIGRADRVGDVDELARAHAREVLLVLLAAGCTGCALRGCQAARVDAQLRVGLLLVHAASLVDSQVSHDHGARNLWLLYAITVLLLVLRGGMVDRHLPADAFRVRVTARHDLTDRQLVMVVVLRNLIGGGSHWLLLRVLVVVGGLGLH